MLYRGGMFAGKLYTGKLFAGPPAVVIDPAPPAIGRDPFQGWSYGGRAQWKDPRPPQPGRLPLTWVVRGALPAVADDASVVEFQRGPIVAHVAASLPAIAGDVSRVTFSSPARVAQRLAASRLLLLDL